MRGYQPRRFSFNKPGGRCEACEGNGQKKIEMHFLPDVWVECDVCHGSRYNPETLAVHYKGRSIADVLQHARQRGPGAVRQHPEDSPRAANAGRRRASITCRWARPAPTLSGGEAQRVKLAAELARPNTGRTLYLLDEPTTGLHFDDIRKLLDVLNRLVDLGNTVIVVEHNLDVIKTADWVIDLGPEAGDAGGRHRRGRARRKSVSPSVQPAVAHRPPSWPTCSPPGPHAERAKYDPASRCRQPATATSTLEAVGTDAQMPWETDGRRWHTVERVTHKGKPCRWEGEILDWIDEHIHERGSFGDTNWNHRTIVEIAGPEQEPGLVPARHDRHGMAACGWSSASAATPSSRPTSIRRLGIRPLNETPGLEVYGNERTRPRGQPQGPVASGHGPRASAERDRHAGLPRVPDRGGRVLPRRT